MPMSSRDNLSYGLNPRNIPEKDSAIRKRKGLISFGDDSDSNNEEASFSFKDSGRRAVNRQIALEQDALRKRVHATTVSSTSGLDSVVYDYDGEYDSFASAGKETFSMANSTQNVPKEKGQSQYISSLLKSAKRRTQQQEVIYERKILKEQAEEDKDIEYAGKEKFITRAYKQRLDEREEWAREEKEREKREEDEDVTKTKAGGDFLYGGFIRNVMLGSRRQLEEKRKNETDGTTTKVESLNSANFRNQHADSTTTEKEIWNNRPRYTHREPLLCDAPTASTTSGGAERTPVESTMNEMTETNTPITRHQILTDRALKIRAARERYFQRCGKISIQ